MLYGIFQLSIDILVDAFRLYEEGAGHRSLTPGERLDEELVSDLLNAEVISVNPLISRFTDELNPDQVNRVLGPVGFILEDHSPKSINEIELQDYVFKLCASVIAEHLEFHLKKFRQRAGDLKGIHNLPSIAVLLSRHSLSELYFLAWSAKRELALDLATLDVPDDRLGAAYVDKTLVTSSNYIQRGYTIQRWDRMHCLDASCLELALKANNVIGTLDELVFPIIESPGEGSNS